MIKKKIAALIMLVTMSFSTVVNAQDISGTGFSNVPVSYSQSSTFTVVMPDSFELDSTKKQDFQIYLSDYDLIDGDKVKVTPTTNTITMENQIVEIPYLVDASATSYQGLPEFPEYKYASTSVGDQYEIFDNYILTQEGGVYRLYCIPRGVQEPKIIVKREIKNDVEYYKIKWCGLNSNQYACVFEDREGTKIRSSSLGFYLKMYTYDKSSNLWIFNNKNNTDIPDTERIIQSTVPIYDGEENYVQMSKEVKAPVDITITMESNLMSDSTPINGTIEGPGLSSGEWLGEVVFEISLVK